MFNFVFLQVIWSRHNFIIPTYNINIKTCLTYYNIMYVLYSKKHNIKVHKAILLFVHVQ